MIKVSDAVNEIVSGDELILEALRGGILNFSACARKIRPTVEELTHKEVMLGSIVTSLTRISQKVHSIPPLRPEVKIDDMSIKYPLIEISFEKTSKSITEINSVTKRKKIADKLFTLTQGVNEITLIIPKEVEKLLLESISDKPKGYYDNLAAITIRFNENDYLEIPNMIYSLVATLASKRINLIEIVSTMTEISFIVRQKDLRQTVNLFERHFTK